VDNRLLATPCTIVSTSDGTADVYGDAVEQSLTIDTTCYYEQKQTSEVEGGAVEESRWLVILPASVSPKGTDRILIGGLSYALVGDPWPAIRPQTGLVDHVECIARRTI